MKARSVAAVVTVMGVLGSFPALSAAGNTVVVPVDSIPGLVGPQGLYGSPRLSLMSPTHGGEEKAPVRDVQTNQVPVPASLVLLGAGAVALAVARRRKRR